MKNRKFLTLICLITACFLLVACSSSKKETAKSEEVKISSMPKIKGFTYYGDVPENPKKVVNFAYSYTGYLLKLGVDVSSYSLDLEKNSTAFGDKLKGLPQLTSADTEAIAAEDPDLIIVFSLDENIDKLKEIAPVLAIEFGASDYLQVMDQLGQVFGKEKEAKSWRQDWDKKVSQTKKKLAKQLKPDTTFTVMDFYDKSIYLYGPEFGRGSELIYRALGYKAPEKVQKDVFKKGWFGVSQEVLGDYIGDYAVVNINKDNKKAASSLKESDVWKNIPAVKEGHVLNVDYNLFYFADPMSLELQLDAFTTAVKKAN
ncbi:ABC transporter substrate-binding protein [Streptococcus thoraltensis]|uniref:ABC transporter substrate-binding protein n=1 Tax=Streptococcus thoraltensis TaxID=55085 RepID=UPI00035EFB52|nr:ABC transporter substrate-binding protein [Streptococcus thoraltensis]MDY4761328.1 ABC transporter substrate-binding protein [Streptococcus thoraltensis]